MPLTEQLVGNVATPLLILMAAVGCVLLITGVNIANLVLARGTGRAREAGAAGRSSGPGAGRGAGQQLVVEGLCLALVGALAAVPVAWWASPRSSGHRAGRDSLADGAGLECR